MHSMADWYQSDQSHLSRILDVAQDLKALSFLLKATPFSFVIDLACLASRREYLKLEKWLHDKIMENQVMCLHVSLLTVPNCQRSHASLLLFKLHGDMRMFCRSRSSRKWLST